MSPNFVDPCIVRRSILYVHDPCSHLDTTADVLLHATTLAPGPASCFMGSTATTVVDSGTFSDHRADHPAPRSLNKNNAHVVWTCNFVQPPVFFVWSREGAMVSRCVLQIAHLLICPRHKMLPWLSRILVYYLLHAVLLPAFRGRCLLLVLVLRVGCCKLHV